MKRLAWMICLLVATGLSRLAPGDSPRADITAAGAVGDGTTLNTRAIQKTIDEVAFKSGGTVVVPAGKFLTGAIFLKPGVNLLLEKEAVLLGSINIDDYPSLPTRVEGHTQVWRPALINADKCDHLQITGPGTIQGGGQPYWDAFLNRRKADPKTKNLDVDRPRNLFIQDSKDVSLSNLSLRDSGFWNVHLYRCQNVTIDKLDIRTPPGAPSTDGMDIDSCQDITISGCYLSVDDDDIAIKGSKGPRADQDKESPADQHIHIIDCTFAHGHGAVTLGSEACEVKDVLVENCRMEDAPQPGETGKPHRNILVRIKLRPDTPQHYQDIRFRNISLKTIGDLISIEPWTQYFELQGHPAPTQQVENITLENVAGTAGGFGKIAAPKDAAVRNITLKNIDLTLKNPKVVIDKVPGLKIENAKINGTALDAGNQ